MGISVTRLPFSALGGDFYRWQVSHNLYLDTRDIGAYLTHHSFVTGWLGFYADSLFVRPSSCLLPLPQLVLPLQPASGMAFLKLSIPSGGYLYPKVFKNRSTLPRPK
jgi:hypothetical protein